MADSYLTISVVARDPYMQSRITACAAQQNAPGDPQVWTLNHAWTWAASPTWAEKWDYALATNVEEPGADAAVITDGDILATVQAMLNAQQGPG